jgi:hypothetical protein
VARQHRLAGAAELVLVHLQAGTDLELIGNVSLAKAIGIAAAGSVLGVILLRGLGFRQCRARHQNDGDDDRYATDHDLFLIDDVDVWGIVLSTVSGMGPK